MRTLAVAFNPATHPATGDAMFDLADNEMSLGMGQHGKTRIGPNGRISSPREQLNLIYKIFSRGD